MAKKILVVEDDPDISKALEIRLKASGFRPVVAMDGEQGWNLVREQKPDLAILDVMLPKLDGFSLCKLIKKDKKLKKIPVIMLTIKGMLGDVEKGFDVGAVSYIPKPYEWEKLYMEILQYLK